MNKAEILIAISKYLARFQEEIEITNSGDDFYLNKIAEDIIIEVLNKTLSLDLINVNYSEKGNYPAIDLLDIKKRVGVQVTATPSTQKIKKTLEKFFSNQVYEKVDSIYIYILTSKLDSYPQASLNEFLDNLNRKFKRVKPITFVAATQVLDRRDLYVSLRRETNLHKLEGVRKYLEEHFGELIVTENLSRHFEKLKNLFYEVVFEDESGMTLQDVYVDPYYSVYENNIVKKENFQTKSQPNFYEPVTKVELNSLLLDFIKGDYDSSLKVSNFLLVLGYPGQGKTSCLKKLLNSYLIADNQNNKDIFYFKLKNVRQGRLLIENPVKVLFEEASNELETEITFSRFKKSILLLDGMDELFMKENMTLDDIEKLCKEISRELSDRYKEMTVIVTSRVGYINLDKLKKENSLIVQLSPFEEKQQVKWVEKYNKFNSSTSLTVKQIKSLHKEKNYKFHYIKELISQPILLQIISTLRGPLDFEKVNRSEIYNRLFTELIERKYSKDGQIENFLGIEANDLRILIQNIAFLIHKRGAGYITKRELLNDREVKAFLSKFPNKDFQNDIKGILISFYFKENKSDTSDDDEIAIEFLHKSLQEYMTAEKIDQRLFENMLDTNKRGQFILDSYDLVLGELNYLFSHQNLSYEIFEFLKELINRRQKEELELMAERLSVYLPELAQKEFLQTENKVIDTPVLSALRTFSCYWFYLLKCNSTKNYLEDKLVREKVMNLITLSSNYKGLISELDTFRNQDFAGSYVHHTSFMDANFENVIFEGSDLNFIQNYECIYNNTNFNSSEFLAVEFNSCDLNYTSFYDAMLARVDFYDCVLNDVNFQHAVIDSMEFDRCDLTKLKPSNFDNASFSEEALRFFLQNKIPFNPKRCFLTEPYTTREPVKITDQIIKRILEP